MDNARTLCQPSAILSTHSPENSIRLSIALVLVALVPTHALGQAPAELIDLRRELDAEGVRLVVDTSIRSALLFDYSSPTLEEIVLLLHDVEPGALAGISEAWAPEVALLEAEPEIDLEGRLSTRLSARLHTFQRYRIRTEGKRLVIVLLADVTSRAPSPSLEETQARDDEVRADASVAIDAELSDGSGRGTGGDDGEGLADPSVANGAGLPQDDGSGADVTSQAPSAGDEETWPRDDGSGDDVAPLPDSPEAAPTHRPDGPAGTRVLDLTYVRDAVSLTIRVETDGAPTHRVFALQEPNRLVLDMMGMEASPPSRRLEIGEAGILRARLAQHQVTPERVVRVVVDLEASVPHRLVIGARMLSVVFLTR